MDTGLKNLSMINLAMIMLGIAMVAAGLIGACSAQADGDRVDPSSSISEQIGRDTDGCLDQCAREFASAVNQPGRFPSASMSAVPPTVYTNYYTKLWRCEQRCQGR